MAHDEFDQVEDDDIPPQPSRMSTGETLSKGSHRLHLLLLIGAGIGTFFCTIPATQKDRRDASNKLSREQIQQLQKIGEVLQDHPELKKLPPPQRIPGK